ncbi:hypothetical protein BDZ94DRAFT_1273865 [Collybia nuda]|uniref:Uncharacterized protein n=1 Tax=Collybia nuda TaxID=64659 RepID=A0A9P5XV76_9AGAR|nr:hypothetical protein BDZ94DRAFT_1273865 [Collybia nuda]
MMAKYRARLQTYDLQPYIYVAVIIAIIIVLPRTCQRHLFYPPQTTAITTSGTHHNQHNSIQMTNNSSHRNIYSCTSSEVTALG